MRHAVTVLLAAIDFARELRLQVGRDGDIPLGEARLLAAELDAEIADAQLAIRQLQQAPPEPPAPRPNPTRPYTSEVPLQ